MFRALLCDTCDCPTQNRPNMLGDFQCDDCAERAYDHWCDRFYEGAGPLSLREQQIQALKIKKGTL